MQLTAIETRVLGALIEKAETTPEHYPLSTQALVTACNQKLNRDPVSEYAEADVLDAVRSLRDEGLVRSVKRPGDRVMKHRHDASTRLSLDDKELAVLAVLLLRGDQTPGELRARTDRYTEFEELPDVDDALERLASRETPLAEQLALQPGQKEARWRSLLGATVSEAGSAPATPAHDSAPLGTRVAALEAEVAAMREDLERLRSALGE